MEVVISQISQTDINLVKFQLHDDYIQKLKKSADKWTDFNCLQYCGSEFLKNIWIRLRALHFDNSDPDPTQTLRLHTKFKQISF